MKVGFTSQELALMRQEELSSLCTEKHKHDSSKDEKIIFGIFAGLTGFYMHMVRDIVADNSWIGVGEVSMWLATAGALGAAGISWKKKSQIENIIGGKRAQLRASKSTKT